jgi:hypothetical protein
MLFPELHRPLPHDIYVQGELTYTSALHLHLIVSLVFNMATETAIKPIPQPPTKFLVGNLGDLDPRECHPIHDRPDPAIWRDCQT